MSEPFSLADITVVICSWNTASTIKDCLESLIENGLSEIILVDANSNDGTRDIAKPFVKRILTDPRMGLATARNIGIAEVTTKFTLNWGADNVLPPNTLRIMLKDLIFNNYGGVSCITLIKNQNNRYLPWVMNLYKISRFYPGIRNVIGTPTLFETKLLQLNPYDRTMSWSDDGDLCDRLSLQGYKFFISNTYVYEIGSDNFHMVLYRWKNYGKSDYETYTKNHLHWTFKRKVLSLTYPFRNELFLPFIKISGLKRFCVLPFLICITTIRYLSWAYFFIKHR